MIGIVCVDKPEGVTSHDVVNQVRRELGIKRVGHAGTLDPIATGLLVMAVGPATRFLQYLPLEPKEYVATFRFGQTTASYDRECEVLVEIPVHDDLENRIAIALPSLTGSIEQIPPMYSAIKQGGKALYELARKGVEVERPTRRIFVESFKQIGLVGHDVAFTIVCSGGTYVRSLAHDLGQAVGCGAHITELRRTRVGRFSVDSAKPPREVVRSDVIPLDGAVSPVPIVKIDAASVELIRHGQSIAATQLQDVRHVALADPSGTIVGMARVEGNRLHPECVIPSEGAERVHAY